MANYCYNEVTFRGPLDALIKARLCFADLAQREYGLPDFCSEECGVFFELGLKDDTISYRTRWDPNLNAVLQVAEHFGLDYTHFFEETGMGLLGEAYRTNGESGIVRLIGPDHRLASYDAACDRMLFGGKYYNDEYDLRFSMLDEKKALAADEAVIRRIAGELPHIEIAGTDYIVDWKAKKLCETLSPAKTLDIGLLGMNEVGDNYVYFYDRRTHELVYTDDLSTLSKDVCILSLPNDGYLDPVGLAREHDLYDTDFLLCYPHQERMVASITEISEVLKEQTSRGRGR